MSKFVMINDAIISLVLFGGLIVKIFFDKLRVGEEEKVYENSYITIIETCLALTIFRGAASLYVFFFFLFTLFLKIFHWISKMRILHVT
jgi:E3 ubiquitin-protein ligase synoviolin